MRVWLHKRQSARQTPLKVSVAAGQAIESGKLLESLAECNIGAQHKLQ
jgi:hypothetical protein